ncbi:hypothetical protein ANCDUO_05550 [Ancylostoma duodenale]|uniref:Uncharacterized protein n=1 Tax=Ancylostoma duodenale TaxID=51022 RepID=A0A0C2D3U3_9BILA|nr:hypothetical protein ANCDUO_05550 [Ancylostoma duodenale]
MLGVTHLTQVRAGLRSSILLQQSKVRDAAAYARSITIRSVTCCINDNLWTKTVSDLNPRNVSAQQQDHQPDGPTSSRSLLKQIIKLPVSLERTESNMDNFGSREGQVEGLVASARSPNSVPRNLKDLFI